jgi:hypothetical protein
MKFNISISWPVFIVFYIACSGVFAYFDPSVYYPIVAAEELISIGFISSLSSFYMLFLQGDLNLVILMVKIAIAYYLMNGSIKVLENKVKFILFSFFIAVPIILYFLNSYLISYDYVSFYLSGIVILFSYILGFVIGQRLFFNPEGEEDSLSLINILCSFFSVVFLYCAGVDEFQSTQIPILFCMMFIGIILSCIWSILLKIEWVNKRLDF